MPMYKAAQLYADDLAVSLPIEMERENDDVIFFVAPEEEGETIEMEGPAPEEDIEISFKLPFLPGGPEDMVEISGDDLTVSDEDEEKKKDKDKAADKPKDLHFIKDHFDKIPKHNGETLGLERAKAHLGRGLGILSKMVQDDHEGVIDIAKAEDARIEMENGIDRLDKELARRKKKASEARGELTKEASTAVHGIIVTVPILISRIARVCINGHVSAGKSIEDLFHRQAEKWKLTDREQVEVIQLIQDMGYPMPTLDRGFMVDDKEPYGYSSEKNFDRAPNYYA